jgi:AraC family transcriptional regulator, ethanolamine operon transcriptional activator
MPDVISGEFVDIDHFREHLRGWDSPALQIEPGRLNIQLRSLDLGGVIFSDIRVNRKLIDHSRPGTGWLKCVVNLSPAIFCGIEVEAGHLTIMTPGREYRSILVNHWYSIEIVVAWPILAEEGLWLAPYLLSGPENATIPLSGELAGKFRGLAKAAFDDLGDRRVDRSCLRSALLRALDTAFGVGAVAQHERDPRRQIEGYALTQRMIRYVESRFGQRVTVKEVAGEFDVSPRALHYAVRSALGISPHDLISAFRLNQVRNELWDARRSGPTVTAAALGQDFGHLGRFSQQYRVLFGELPSETLHRIRLLGRA